MVKKTHDNRSSRRNWNRTNLLHAGAGLLAVKIATVSTLGPLGIALVGANYVSVTTTGKNLLSNPFTKKNVKSQNVLTDDVIDIPADDSRKPSRCKPDNALFKVIKAVERPDQKRLRRKATLYSLLSTTLAYSTPLTMSLVFATIVTGGLPVLAQLGLRNVFVQLGVMYGGMTGLAALESAARHRSTKAWKGYAADLEHALRSDAAYHACSLLSDEVLS